ncbi:hypothetical protein QR680_015909 [Steinernema hermaphroditum]|uniref:7TM GPCR serpentine receptor class x (Srx) domain-containing protein n=1 Tax=Steinernema hermaphroditum TaxID=289476 RepID=A0AA39LL13_9BILA|nr:hypothetical protein QR680_015909 [Steinernema hermaphroditum]
MNSTEISSDDRAIGAAVMFLFGSLSVCINLFVIFGVRHSKSFGDVFGMICISQCTANCGNGAVFGLLVAPITLMNPAWHATYWGSRCGQLLIMFWNADLLSHLVTSINRFSIMFFTMRYSQIFTKKTMKISIAIVWTIAACQAAPYFNYDCTLQLDMKSQTFQFLITPCTPYVALYFDWYLSLCLIGTITAIDLITLWKITRMKASADAERNRRRKRDRRFFFQTVAQGTVIVTELTFYFYISTLMSHKWVQFAMTTFAWILAHTLDGFMIIIFNKELRSLKCSVVVTTSSTTSQISHGTVSHTHQTSGYVSTQLT